MFLLGEIPESHLVG